MKGEGLDALRREIIARLPEGPPLYPPDYLTDQPQRFLAAEILREKILHFARQEVPHSVAVQIESWEETDKLVRIAATIYVERPGQKAIVIGPGGAALKKIGTQARKELEYRAGPKSFPANVRESAASLARRSGISGAIGLAQDDWNIG